MQIARRMMTCPRSFRRVGPCGMRFTWNCPPSEVRHVVKLRGQEGLGEKVTDGRNRLKAVKDLGDIHGLVELGRGGGGNRGSTSDDAAHVAECRDSSLGGLPGEFHDVVAIEYCRDNHAAAGIEVQGSR